MNFLKTKFFRSVHPGSVDIQQFLVSWNETMGPPPRGWYRAKFQFDTNDNNNEVIKKSGDMGQTIRSKKNCRFNKNSQTYFYYSKIFFKITYIKWEFLTNILFWLDSNITFQISILKSYRRIITVVSEMTTKEKMMNAVTKRIRTVTLERVVTVTPPALLSTEIAAPTTLWPVMVNSLFIWFLNVYCMSPDFSHEKLEIIYLFVVTSSNLLTVLILFLKIIRLMLS